MDFTRLNQIIEAKQRETFIYKLLEYYNTFMKQLTHFGSFLLLLLLFISCDRAQQLKKELLTTKTETSLPIVQSAAAEQEWFEGRIVAKQDLTGGTGGFLTEKIEYTIGRNQIKREIQRGVLSKDISGIIVDLEKQTVLLYQGNRVNKYYLKLSLEAYKTYVLGNTNEEQAKESINYPGYGRVFLLIPPTPAYKTKNDPDSRKVVNLTCDVLAIYFQSKDFSSHRYKLEVTHCQEIKVNRSLIELTEPNLPKEVKGFPCIYKLNLISSNQTKDSTQIQTSRSVNRWLNKATKLIHEMKQEIESIERKTIPESAFSLSDSYSEVANISELNGHFPGDDSGTRSGWGGDD